MNCNNCGTVQQIQLGYENCCENCGLVLLADYQCYLNDFEENENPTYFTSIIKDYDPLNYFKRRIRCLMGNQRVIIDRKLIETIKRKLKPQYWTSEDLKEYLKLKKLPKHYINVNLILEYLLGVKENFDSDFINDLTIIYTEFLNIYFKKAHRLNKIKTPPVEFTCRRLLLFLIEYVNEENILLNYEPEYYLKYFKEMLSVKRIDNLKIVDEVIQEINFNNLKIKYKFKNKI